MTQHIERDAPEDCAHLAQQMLLQAEKLSSTSAMQLMARNTDVHQGVWTPTLANNSLRPLFPEYPKRMRSNLKRKRADSDDRGLVRIAAAFPFSVRDLHRILL